MGWFGARSLCTALLQSSKDNSALCICFGNIGDDQAEEPSVHPQVATGLGSMNPVESLNLGIFIRKMCKQLSGRVKEHTDP